MAGELYASENFDLNAVEVPLTGLAAFAPVTQANVITDEMLGSDTLRLPSGFRQLGLYKQDGGVEEGRDDEDALEFFQEGYKQAGLSSQSVTINLAEGNLNVNALIDGIEPNEHGVVYVPSSLPDATFILFVATRFKNNTEIRRCGVARVSAVEIDQEERGAVKGKAVTFDWVPDPLFNGAPYKKWMGTPGGVKLVVTPETVSVKENATTALNAKVTPSGRTVAWSSADDRIAKVSPAGVVTGVKAGGPVEITAKVGSVTAKVNVTVTSAG